MIIRDMAIEVIQKDVVVVVVVVVVVFVYGLDLCLYYTYHDECLIIVQAIISYTYYIQ